MEPIEQASQQVVLLKVQIVDLERHESDLRDQANQAGDLRGLKLRELKQAEESLRNMQINAAVQEGRDAKAELDLMKLAAVAAPQEEGK